jgi:hypothetical protein
VKKSFRTTGDTVLAVALVLAAAAGLGVAYRFSDARATTSEVGTTGVKVPPEPTEVPTTLSPLWQAPSNRTAAPVVAADVVTTGNGGEVTGRDALTGQRRWRYARDIDLCTVAEAWNSVLAVFHKNGNCGEVTDLDAVTGARGPQRNSDTERDTQLITDGRHVATTGRTLIEAWRSDLVRTLQYGELPTSVQPDKQPRTGCRFESFVLISDRLAITEHCGDSERVRITVQKPDPKNPEPPEEYFSTLLAETSARMVTVTERTTTVVTGDPAKLVVLDDKGNRSAEYPLSVPVTDTHPVPDVTDGTEARFWFTGAGTVALAEPDSRPLWTLPNTLGAGTEFAGRLLVPVREGLAVVNPTSGVRERVIPIDRQGYTGSVRLDHAGPVLFEQRGPTLFALR